MRFSQKQGKTTIRESIQIESIDKRLENRLWNSILNDFFKKKDSYSFNYGKSKLEEVCLVIWQDFFGERADEIPSYNNFGVAGLAYQV